MGKRDNALFSRDLKYLVRPVRYKYPQSRPKRRGGWVIVALVGSAVGGWMFFGPGSDAALDNNYKPIKQASVIPGTRTLTQQFDDIFSVAPVTWPRATATSEMPIADTGAAPSPATSDTVTESPERMVKLTLPQIQRTITDIPTASSAASTRAAVHQWSGVMIRKGDTLAGIFHRRGLRPADAIKLAGLDGATMLTKLRPGRELRIGTDAVGEFAALHYELNPIEYLSIRLDDNRYEVGNEKRQFEIRYTQSQGVIESSLFRAGATAGLSDPLLIKLVGVFGWDIDFALDLRRGDRFAVIYEEQLVEGEKIGNGGIVAAEFINNGETYRAIRHIDSDGFEAYFTPAGQSVRRTFLRTPVKFSRISSTFSKRRYHPVLKTWRAHRGVDYAAPRGTPILATADGRVVRVGTDGGYGKSIVIRHGGNYSTLYAHLSRYSKGLKIGKPVRQGQTIGYIGSTGLATGPHLHYEFRVNRVHRDPLKFKQPKADPIDSKYRDAFLRDARVWVARLDTMRAPSAVALVD